MGHMVKYPDRRDGSTLFDFYGNIIPASGVGLVFTAKGDIPVGTGPGAGVMQAVGTDGQVLTADHTQTDGVKWATPASPGSGTISDITSADSTVAITGATGPTTDLSVKKTVNISHTWAIQGPIIASATVPVPGFFAPVLATGQTMTLIEADYVLLAGTCTVAVDQNGSGVTGLTALGVTTGAAHTSATGPPSVASRDVFSIVITSPSGASGLTVTLVFSVTV